MQEETPEKLVKAFTEAKYRAGTDLSEEIWRAIIVYEKRRSRIKLWTFSLVSFGSLAWLIPVLMTLSKSLTQSGFYQYFSLAFSDIGKVASLWKEFGFLLTEALPIVSILATLILLFIFFLSLRYTMKQIIIKNQLAL